jgi:hypothetical protein
MQSIRTGRIAVAAATATLIVAAASPAANTPGGPVGSVKASVSPNHLVPGLTNKHGMPIKLKVHLGITHPAGSRYRLEKVVVKFPAGVGKPNGNLFPSCSVAKLEAAHNRLSACPKGSKIGSGKAVGTAVDIGVTSSGVLTLFNGPKGKSVTFNVNVTTPALINKTFSAPLRKISGRYGYVLTSNVPTELQNILDGPIIVRSIDVTTFATRVVNGVKRGYVEAFKCPKSHKAPLHADFSFNTDTGGSATSSADTNIACH